MADFKINPNQRIDEAKSTSKLIIKGFGLKALETSIYDKRIPALGQDAPLHTSELGTGVFSDLDISSASYVDQNTGLTKTTPAFKLDTVLFVVAQQKSIVLTPIIGRNGTVKEYISDNDFSINVRGIITSGQNGIYPRQSFKDLFDNLKAPIALPVNSWYLNQMGIFSLVVTDYTLPQREGYYAQQLFELNCLSDEPVELQLSKNA